ncbi:4-methylaminobutanoate oxidase (formaldehyde-forming) [Planctomycetes bacterium Poly30]|uniref:4-methylaminobutanoate oxidase (Formaldehyde-forming) n=1 Tax=Saltatorellus ferox TaxID=2528018 RepID=A0A518F0N8_9BACT|nr:4-methylaminobutanoate oxidase (formaldehyde-forming) [Planctomycetes bacterium Poly30]
MKAKILIVGGGAMGTSIALSTAKRCDPLTEPVILIEKGTLGSGSSGRTGAVIHQGYPDRVLAGMARDALKVYAGMNTLVGRSVGYKRTGVLVVAGSDPQAIADLKADVAMQSELGINVKVVNAAEMRALCPGISVADDAKGSYEPDGGYVEPRRTIKTIAALARSYGASTRTGVHNPTVLVENGRAVGVSTSEGEFRAPNVVLAVGPWTPLILKNLGVEMPLRIVRIEETFCEMPDPPALEDMDEIIDDDIETRFQPDPLDLMPAAHPVILDRPNGLHLRCEPKEKRTRIGRLGFDGLEELERPESLDEDVTDEFRNWATPRVLDRMPVYKDMAPRGNQAAWITLTPDQRPIVGPVKEIPGLWIVTGFSGNDFQLAPSIGEGLAQMILGQPVSAIDPEFFSPSRFATV